jgi:hypothetical protein
VKYSQLVSMSCLSILASPGNLAACICTQHKHQVLLSVLTQALLQSTRHRLHSASLRPKQKACSSAADNHPSSPGATQSHTNMTGQRSQRHGIPAGLVFGFKRAFAADSSHSAYKAGNSSRKGNKAIHSTPQLSGAARKLSLLTSSPRLQ